MSNWLSKDKLSHSRAVNGGSPKISIITPSFRNSRWLKLCIASVADQMVEHEHIVQDSCSDDGTQEWLAQDTRVHAFIEKDSGMYDAVNRGLRRASGEILAYINCDEQYLPGALTKVSEFFDKNPLVEVAFASTVVVRPDGEYLCQREPVLPQKFHTWVCRNLATLTCATFVRRSVIFDRGILFNPNWKAVGDADWVLRLLNAGVRMAIIPAFTSAFTETGDNLILRPESARELCQFTRSAPRWMQLAKPLLVAHHRLRRLAAGHYRAKPLTFSIYTLTSPNQRVIRRVTQPTFRWVRPKPEPRLSFLPTAKVER